MPSTSQENKGSIRERFTKIAWPKTVTEIHVHLGGSVPLYRLWELAVRRGIRGMGDGYEEFVNIVRRQEGKVFDLDSYLEIYDRIELIQSGPDAIRESLIIAIHRAFLMGGMLRSGPGGEASEGSSPLFHIGRLELRMNPLKRTGAVFLKGEHAGLFDVDRVISAMCSAIDDVHIGFRNRIQTGLIFCFGRDMTFEANRILAQKIRSWRERSSLIVGVDLAGSERINPLSDPSRLEEMRICFEEAGTGIGRTVHVGETRHIDVQTFQKTVEALNPTRVAHPIVAFRALWENKDDRGIQLLKERDLVCELCFKSNLLTGAVKDVQEYKRIIDILDENGIRYTFSTDAPSLQVASLADELFSLFQAGALQEEQILRALSVAEHASFL